MFYKKKIKGRKRIRIEEEKVKNERLREQYQNRISKEVKKKEGSGKYFRILRCQKPTLCDRRNEANLLSLPIQSSS